MASCVTSKPSGCNFVYTSLIKMQPLFLANQVKDMCKWLTVCKNSPCNVIELTVCTLKAHFNCLFISYSFLCYFRLLYNVLCLFYRHDTKPFSFSRFCQCKKNEQNWEKVPYNWTDCIRNMRPDIFLRTKLRKRSVNCNKKGDLWMFVRNVTPGNVLVIIFVINFFVFSTNQANVKHI